MKKVTALLFSVLFLAISKAQDLPNDLQSVSTAPTYSTYFSIANWPVFPPCPVNCWGESNPLYYSPSWNAIFVDDRASTAEQLLSSDASSPSGAGGGLYEPDGPGGPDDPTDYGTNLWLSISAVTNLTGEGD